jgi:demethylmenaquinone methyltransferase / 2-methoxy-6-polyprenyl-1,4-benzoquinol methylase
VNETAARELFDTNADTYDRVNTFISFGLDSRWRRWAAYEAVSGPGARVLDAFAGTGLVGLRCAALGADVTLADVSPRMLEVASTRAAKAGVGLRIALTDLTAPDSRPPGAPFDAITMVFGARYVDDPARVIGGLSRLLSPDGRFVLVDFVEPDGSLLSRLAAVYFFGVLPRIASVLAGHRELYDRLVATTHDMGSAAHLISLAEDAGLEISETRTMGFGLVCGIVGRRADAFNAAGTPTASSQETRSAAGVLPGDVRA